MKATKKQSNTRATKRQAKKQIPDDRNKLEIYSASDKSLCVILGDHMYIKLITELKELNDFVSRAGFIGKFPVVSNLSKSPTPETFRKTDDDEKPKIEIVR